MKPNEWVRLPSGWIGEKRLTEFEWGHAGAGADQVAALTLLIIIAHSVDPDTGIARITYDEITTRTGLSRPKVSRALKVLQERQLITRPAGAGRSEFGLANYDQVPWAKLPFRGMYDDGRIRVFHEFRLRKVIELDALKLFLLFAQRRDQSTNLANISYDKIVEYAGVARVRIKHAISFLVVHMLIHVEQIPSRQTDHGIAHAYRLVGIDPHNHMGTRGRAMLQAVPFFSEDAP
ncbi:MAG TPA: winged helix-turn-helix domain-containing protein [Vicinamibacterales bacterium]|nr:winged helix-turn-helix domain-containing protein [Vicinamibacterales bacterium]